ncbi:hypothetical protein LQ759_09610 [Serratia marcescens]|nr:hypothetical protein [Serratia marcescens]
MTLTTDELRQIAETDHVQCGDAAAMARELLANREAQPVAWEMRYWNNGYNIWGDWERISEGLYTRLSAEHAADNDYEFRVLYDAPPVPAVVKLPTEFYSDEGIVVRLEQVMAALALIGVKYERKGDACRAAILEAGQ